MWPFSRKIASPAYSVPQQVLAFKSLPLPEMQPTWRLFPKRQDNWLPEVAIAEGYNASAIVYAVVEKRAKLISSVPWRAERLVGDQWVHEPSSPLQLLMDEPNPHTSWLEMMYQVSQSLDLSGNAYINEVKGGSRNQPFQIWHLPPQFIKIKPGKDRLIEKYEYWPESGSRYVIDELEMIHLKMPNPNSLYFGMPVLMSAGRATDIDRESGNWQKASLQNRGVLDVHIEVPPEVSAEQRAEIRDKWQERQGGPMNARAPIVSSGKINSLGQNAVEMDFVASRKAVWTEIAAVFGVPLAALGFTENVNLANADAMEKQMWQATIIPQLELIKRQFTSQLAREFGNEWRMSPDLSAVPALQEDFGDRLANAERLLRMGFTRNEINTRLELGFEETPDGNTRYEPAGLLPSLEAPTDEDKQNVMRLAYG
jgi:HK97 family phage portal protein